MANGKAIEEHPRRQEIDEDICKGVRQVSIAKKYGVSQTTVSQYIRNSFATAKARADLEQELSHGEVVIETMRKQLATLEQMRLSIIEWLTDPEDPSKWFVGPRANEIDVVYDGPRFPEGVYRERKSLQTLLDKIHSAHPEYEIIEVNVKTDDQRKLLLNTINSTARQLQVWVNTEVASEHVRTEQAVREILGMLVPLLLEEAKGNYELQQKVGDILRSVQKRLAITD